MLSRLYVDVLSKHGQLLIGLFCSLLAAFRNVDNKSDQI